MGRSEKRAAKQRCTAHPQAGADPSVCAPHDAAAHRKPRLSCSHSFHLLSQVPPAIVGLSALTLLDLSYNALHSLRPGAYLKRLVVRWSMRFTYLPACAALALLGSGCLPMLTLSSPAHPDVFLHVQPCQRPAALLLCTGRQLARQPVHAVPHPAQSGATHSPGAAPGVCMLLSFAAACLHVLAHTRGGAPHGRNPACGRPCLEPPLPLTLCSLLGCEFQPSSPDG